MNDFQRAVQFVLWHETVFAKGSYGDFSKAVTELVPGDNGGATKFGIDQASHPDVDVAKLTLDQATDIYRDSYWVPSRAAELPWPLNLAHFDAAVNCGINRANKILQNTVNVDADGIFGPQTALAVYGAWKQDGTVAVSLHACDLRKTFYKNLCDEQPSKMKFLKGWLNRVSDLELVIQKPI